MVKKGSFFGRLADRFRSASGMRVEPAAAAAASRDLGSRGAAPVRPQRSADAVRSETLRTESPRSESPRSESPRADIPRAEFAGKEARPTPEPLRKENKEKPVVTPEPGPSPAAFDLPSTGFAEAARSTRKLSEREEAMVALGGHFQELAQLMRGVHTRMDSQLGRLVEAAASLQSLPALQNQQLDLLRGLAGHMERQNSLGEQIAKSLHGMPQLMQNVETALQRAAQSDERTASTMRDFQSTMDRIHASMGKMVEHSEQQTKATQQVASQREQSLQTIVKSVEQAQQASVRELRQATDEGLQSLRRTHEDQSNRLQRVVQEHAGWNKAVLVVLGIVALGMATTLVITLLK